MLVGFVALILMGIFIGMLWAGSLGDDDDSEGL